VGERPHAPWHPLPLSELLILVGGVGTVIALRRGEVQNGGTALFVSLGAVMVGTVEVTLREHLSGYRSHTLILSLLPTIMFHSVLVLVLAAFFQLPRWVTSALLALDLALFAFLFKLLRARFLDARRERTFAGRR
jgi:ABC-type antimicrobial peptide transport system permease subunit